MKILSFDPGTSGAIVLIENGRPSKIYDMPVTKIGSKKRIDLPVIARIIHKLDPTAAVIEQVGASPMMGTASAFGFGFSLGGLIGVCEGAEVFCHTITPQKWKAYHGLLKKPKDAARLKVIEMFPDMSEQFKLKKHVDRADALLLGLAWRGMHK